MTISRREALKLAAALGIAPTLLLACDDDGGGVRVPSDGGADGGVDGGPLPDMGLPDDGFPRYAFEGEPGPPTLFEHGVASGDPLPEAVILWTRASGADDLPVEVFWELALAPDFRTRAQVGTAEATPERDFTVKLDVTDLDPGTTYYYRFNALGRTSAIGRTRTAPTGGVDRVRMAIVSCASLAHGWFHAYAHVAAEADLDAVVHLGDYIYEYGNDEYGDLRQHEPGHEIVSLEDYRMRYSQYRREAPLLAMHQQHPLIAIWDDHETANNSWSGGAENHDPDEGSWADRRAAAVQAWFEWLPVRETEDQHIYRRLQYGDLMDLILLDTRLWARDAPPEGGRAQEDRFDEDLILLGQDQEAWLREQLTGSDARWKVVGQQVMMAQLQPVGRPNSEGGGTALNFDQWDGYAATRERFFDLLTNEEIDDVVVLTGDIHTSWAMDLSPDPNEPAAYDPETGVGAIAVEFVTPSVTSPGLPEVNPALLNFLLTQNPHMKWVELTKRGFIVLDVDHQRTQAAWFHLDSIDTADRSEIGFARAYSTQTGENRIVEDVAPAAPRANAPALAPIQLS